MEFYFVYVYNHICSIIFSSTSNMPRKQSRTDGGMIGLLKLVGLNTLSCNKCSFVPTFWWTSLNFLDLTITKPLSYFPHMGHHARLTQWHRCVCAMSLINITLGLNVRIRLGARVSSLTSVLTQWPAMFSPFIEGFMFKNLGLVYSKRPKCKQKWGRQKTSWGYSKSLCDH